MRRHFLGFAVGSLALASSFLAARSVDAADIAAGKEKAQMCAGCHGENGISQMENVPSLAGQLDQYIQWQLVFFRAGARKNEQMQPMSAAQQWTSAILAPISASLTPPKI
jgi:cytochrome c553